MLELHTVYRQPGRYAGWPANYGIWNWGDEIVVAFTLGWFKADVAFHPRDKDRPFINVQARSLDGGLSWQFESFNGTLPYGRGLSADEHMNPPLQLQPLLEQMPPLPAPSSPIDFQHPDLAIMLARTGLDAGTISFFYFSTDRCRSWQGPCHLPGFGQSAVAARTAYLIEGQRQALFFLTSNKSDGDEGQVFCARTRDGGMSFEFVSSIGGEPGAGSFNIMPACLALPDGRLLAALRCRSERIELPHASIDLYQSLDHGCSWLLLSQPVRFLSSNHSGNPPALLQLRDGRLALLYGNRDTHAICARLSADQGMNWSEEIVLRQSQGDFDLGYVRACLRADGAVVAVYYLNDQIGGLGERFIESCLWKPTTI